MADQPTVLEPVIVTARRVPSGPGGGVKTFQPKVSIILKKVVGRSSVGGGIGVSERFSGSAREIDLTKFLGEGDSVVVQHSVREGAGRFSLSFTDRMDVLSEDSLVGLVEPMDVVEIRMARDPSVHAGKGYPGNLPIIMRGFVSRIGRTMEMTRDGPRRGITISGQDYGKILQIMRIVYLPGNVLGQDLLTAYKLFLNYGVEAQELSASNFVVNVVEKVVKPFLDKIRGQASGSDSPIVDLQVEAIADSGAVSPFGAQEWAGGSVDDLLRKFGDVGAWNELFVEDRDEGPFLVYRPTPFKSLDGSMIQAAAVADTVYVRDEALISIVTDRSDDNVANYFWVDSPHYNMIDGSRLQAAAAGGDSLPKPFLDDYANSSPDLYGVRVMETQTEQGARLDGQSEADIEAGRSLGNEMVAERRRVLLENNKDNVVYEAGSLSMRGDETVGAGKYLVIERGPSADFTFEVYAHTVTHAYTFGGAFTTQVVFDRGTGFVERLQRGSGAASPYLSEMTLKGTYG